MSSTPANFGFGFGDPASSGGSGFNAAPVFGGTNVSTVRSNISGGLLWQDNASEPFGRVGSTAQCFARNGEAASRSKWTPPKPPNRPLFQSHSTARDTVPLFGHSTQQQSSPSLFGTSGANTPFSGNQTSAGSGEFSFGGGDTATSRTNTTSSSAFGTGLAQNTTGSLFGRASSGMAFGYGGAGTVFGSASSVGFNKNADPNQTHLFGKSATGVGGTRTVFGSGSSSAKPPLAPSSNPFTTSTSNPFATKSAPASTSSPFFTFTSTSSNIPSIAANPFAVKVSSTESVNPFAAKVSSKVTVNPFSENFSIQDAPGKYVFAVPGSAGSGSASMKFKSGLRPAYKPTTSSWGTGRQPLVQTQQASPQSFAWTSWEKKKESTLPKVEKSFTMSGVSSSETKCSFDSTSSTPATSSQTDALVASPDTNPYGAGSFGTGIIEEKIKTAIANPPLSVELKVLDDRSSAASSSSISRQQSSARFTARLGLARQPLRVLPMRPVHPRFPSRRLHTVPSDARAKLTQADPFSFSSSFSRLAISKKTLRIRVEPSSMPANTVTDKIEEVRTADAKTNESIQVDRDESGEEDSNSLLPACPVFLNKEYFTEPSASELKQLNEEELSCVKNFVIGRRGCGKISFINATDVRGLHLDKLVTFSEGKVVVYPDVSTKPAIGSALNKPAIVDLHGISAEENESHEVFLQRLKNHTQTLGATFLGYEENSKTGSGGVWSFRVEHF